MSNENTYDVVVVGAGPAGSSCAYELARQGVRVALVEKAAMPRYKTCGGGIVARALKLLPIDASEAIDRRCHAAQLILADAGLSFMVKREEPLVSMTMRENLDLLLFRAAAQAGAHVIEGCRVVDVASSNGKMEITTEKGSLFCRFVIGADGANSLVARKSGWRERLRLIPLVEWEVPVDDSLLEAFSGSARFEFGPVPAGYAWVFPKKRHLSVGLGGYSPERVDLRAKLREFLKASGIAPADRVGEHGYFIPSNPRKEGFAKGRVLLAGDAAGFVDPVTGEGITYALLSGQGAARALISGGFSPRRVEEAFVSEITASVLRELRWAKLLAVLLYRSAKIRTLLFRQYGTQLTEAFADIIVGDKSYAALCKKHIGLRHFFRLAKHMG
jgi:geranylgeranyl reductase family protein